MVDETDIFLSSGKTVRVHMPPLSLDYMEQLQRETLKRALKDPAILAILTADEIMDLFLQVSRLNDNYWITQAQTLLKR